MPQTLRSLVDRLLHEPVIVTLASSAVASFAAQHGFSLTADQALGVFAAVSGVLTGGWARAKVVTVRALEELAEAISEVPR